MNLVNECLKKNSKKSFFEKNSNLKIYDTDKLQINLLNKFNKLTEKDELNESNLFILGVSEGFYLRTNLIKTQKKYGIDKNYSKIISSKLYDHKFKLKNFYIEKNIFDKNFLKSILDKKNRKNIVLDNRLLNDLIEIDQICKYFEIVCNILNVDDYFIFEFATFSDSKYFFDDCFIDSDGFILKRLYYQDSSKFKKIKKIFSIPEIEDFLESSRLKILYLYCFNGYFFDWGVSYRPNLVQVICKKY